MNTGAQLTGIERVLLEENVANRRKPRMYASFQFGSDKSLYPLDFCIWLHRNYENLVAAINSNTLFEFQGVDDVVN